MTLMAGMDGGTGNHDCLCGVGAGHYPFMKFSFFEGYFARIIGAVISWIAGLALAGLLYYVIHSPQVPIVDMQVREHQGEVSLFANAEE